MKKPNVLRTGNRIKTPWGDTGTVGFICSGDGIPYQTLKEARRKQTGGVLCVSIVENSGYVLAELVTKL